MKLFKYLLILIPLLSFSQEKKLLNNMELNGYISDMQSVIASKETFQTILDSALNNIEIPEESVPLYDEVTQKASDNIPWQKDNQIHARLNYKWYINDNFTFTAQLRTLFNWGDNTLYNYALDTTNDKWNFDSRALQLTQSNWPNYSLSSTLDRIWLQYTLDNFEVTIGRQRINWGQTFAFNPNDIFNTYSFFEYDYPEKPGSDAIRVQYYTGMVTSLEWALKIGENDKITTGLLWKANKWNYDLQFLAGYYNETDYVGGLGWSGYIKDFSFRGEASYFQPQANFTDTTGVLVASIGTDYSFANSLFLQFEFLYNQFPKGFSTGNIFALYGNALSSKTISITEYTLMANGSYPLTPLINSNLSLVYYPDLKGIFTGPSIDLSLKDNLDLSVASQVFSLKNGDKRSNTFIGFIRIKGSF